MPIAKSPADLMPLPETLKLSGLEFLQAIISGDTVGPPIGETMGFTLKDVKKGCQNK